LGCWISPCYGLFSLGTRFETDETFISLIFQLFGLRILNQQIQGHDCTAQKSIQVEQMQK
jgi:hypothetical protein